MLLAVGNNRHDQRRTCQWPTFSDEKDLAAAAKRARTVRAKAVENFEERGIQTLFLAYGMATWTNTRGTATPAAPVFLRAAHLVPKGGAGEDFAYAKLPMVKDLEAAGETLLDNELICHCRG